MIDSAFAPVKSGVGSGYSSATPTMDSGVGSASSDNPKLIPLSSSHSPKKSSGRNKSHRNSIIFFISLFIILVGGLLSAYILTQRSQDIRQKAIDEARVTRPSPQPFSLKSTGSATITFLPESDGPIPKIEGQLSFATDPSCGDDNNCQAQTKFEASSPLEEGVWFCSLLEANIKSYSFLTNTQDPNYPKNLPNNDPASDITANCNRSLAQCREDVNCSESDSSVLTSKEDCVNSCGVLEGRLPFSVTNTEYSCGCVQYVIDQPRLTITCQNEQGGEKTKFTYIRENIGETSGPWAYAYNDQLCSGQQPPTTPPLPTLTPTITPTPIPSAPSPPIGEMCVSISSSPSNPQFNDTVTLTCGLVAGAGSYEFRYFNPNSSSPISLLASSTPNISQGFQVTQVGQYTAQCRVCPVVTSTNQYCNDPNWGWGAIIAPPTNRE